MTNTVSAKERNLDPDMDAIIARMMNVTKRGTTLATNQKYFVLLAICAAQGLSEEAEGVTAAALKAAVEPIAIKEAVYQTAPYVGIGRVKEALEGVNKALKEAGVRLPLASQTAVNDQNRLAKGIEVQTAIFGDAITQMHKNTTEPMKPLMINDLSGYCFGDLRVPACPLRIVNWLSLLRLQRSADAKLSLRLMQTQTLKKARLNRI